MTAHECDERLGRVLRHGADGDRPVALDLCDLLRQSFKPRKPCCALLVRIAADLVGNGERASGHGWAI